MTSCQQLFSHPMSGSKYMYYKALKILKTMFKSVPTCICLFVIGSFLHSVGFKFNLFIIKGIKSFFFINRLVSIFFIIYFFWGAITLSTLIFRILRISMDPINPLACKTYLAGGYIVGPCDLHCNERALFLDKERKP